MMVFIEECVALGYVTYNEIETQGAGNPFTYLYYSLFGARTGGEGNNEAGGGGGGGSGGNGVVTLASTRELAAANSNAAQYGHMNGNARGFGSPISTSIKGSYGGGSGGYTNNKNTFSNTNNSARPSPSVSLGNLNKASSNVYQQVHIPGSSLVLSHPSMRTPISMIAMTRTGRELLYGIDYMSGVLSIQTPIYAGNRNFFAGRGHPLAAGLTSYHDFIWINYLSIAPEINVDITAVFEGSVDIDIDYANYQTFTLIEIIAHELGHLHHFLSFMTNNQIFGSIYYKYAVDKENYADKFMNAIIQELKILGITY